VVGLICLVRPLISDRPIGLSVEGPRCTRIPCCRVVVLVTTAFGRAAVRLVHRRAHGRGACNRFISFAGGFLPGAPDDRGLGLAPLRSGHVARACHFCGKKKRARQQPKDVAVMRSRRCQSTRTAAVFLSAGCWRTGPLGQHAHHGADLDGLALGGIFAVGIASKTKSKTKWLASCAPWRSVGARGGA